MLKINNLTYRIGERVLLNATGATVNPGQRVGLVGANGVGKTTLLRLITNELDVDGGEIEMPSRWRVGITSQEAPSGPKSLLRIVVDSDAELARLTAQAETETDPDRLGDIHMRLQDKDAYSAPSRAARILAGLGFDDEAQQQPCESFSGGWRMRVALASLLFTQPDLLLLDEPTNHLDLEATLWLEDYLKRYRGAVLIVSHDRDLLNRAVGQILHLEHGKLTMYQGGYDQFEETRRMRLELDAKQRIKAEAQRAHMQKFVDRFRYQANKAKQAQSRIKMLARLQPVAEVKDGWTVNFEFPNPEPRLSSPLLSFDNIVLGYDDKPVLSDVTLRLGNEDRIALLGANGNGKSTLIKSLAGRLAAMSGDIAKSNKLRIGYFAQHQTDELDVQATPLIQLGRLRPREPEVTLRKQLGRFGFSQQRADTLVGNLSGGEKARLLFALMSVEKPHILLLDEPTNHLDVESRQALVHAVNSFEGAVVIVSHDPHLVELTADNFWLVEDGGIRTYDGDMEDYRARLLGNRGKGNGKGNGRGNGKPVTPEQAIDKKEKRRQSAEQRQALAPLKKQLARAEKSVDRLEKEKAELTAAMSDPELYSGDAEKVVALQKDLGWVQNQLNEAEEAWLDLQAQLEQM